MRDIQTYIERFINPDGLKIVDKMVRIFPKKTIHTCHKKYLIQHQINPNNSNVQSLSIGLKIFLKLTLKTFINEIA